MKFRKFEILLTVLFLAICMAIFAEVQPATAQTADIVIDAVGREVAIPEKVERIVITCRGGTTNQVAILGAVDKIMGQPGQKAFPQLVKMYPQFKDIIDAGSFEDTNIEEVLKLEPDIVLAGYSSPKANETLEENGLIVYTMQIGWATTETIRDEFKNMGKILRNEEQSDKLVAYWDEKLAMVEDLLKNIPDSERKTVYYTGKKLKMPTRAIGESVGLRGQADELS